MNFFTKLFKPKEKPVLSYAEFWKWFGSNANEFHAVVKSRYNVDENFFKRLAPKLDAVKEGFFYLAGMDDESTAELIITVEGIVGNMLFAEELVEAAPAIRGWKFTALKPALAMKDISIEMDGYQFNGEKLSFYSNEHSAYPDEIDIVVAHEDMNEDNRELITNGCYIFLDNYLGELDFAVTVDNLQVIGKAQAEKELIPIAKLKDFLTWRQKEFVEKYEGTRYNTGDDTHAVFEAKFNNGNAAVATINTALLQWDAKASHPWVATLVIPYDGRRYNGMPGEDASGLLQAVQNDIERDLKDFEGHLQIGRQTGDNQRQIYFACKEFRKPSKIFYEVQRKYAGKAAVTYEIYKDKYWQSFERFQPRS